jgi:hypothetical protein
MFLLLIRVCQAWVQGEQTKSMTPTMWPLRVVAAKLGADVDLQRLQAGLPAPSGQDPSAKVPRPREASAIRARVLPSLAADCFFFDVDTHGDRQARRHVSAPLERPDKSGLRTCRAANTDSEREFVVNAFRACNVSDEDRKVFNQSKKRIYFYWCVLRFNMRARMPGNANTRQADARDALGIDQLPESACPPCRHRCVFPSCMQTVVWACMHACMHDWEGVCLSLLWSWCVLLLNCAWHLKLPALVH